MLAALPALTRREERLPDGTAVSAAAAALSPAFPEAARLLVERPATLLLSFAPVFVDRVRFARGPPPSIDTEPSSCEGLAASDEGDTSESPLDVSAASAESRGSLSSLDAKSVTVFRRRFRALCESPDGFRGSLASSPRGTRLPKAAFRCRLPPPTEP